MTAFGTVGAVAAAVGIALWADWKSGQRVDAERKRSDAQLAEERALSARQIDEERRIAKEREQLTEAYRVQVVSGWKRTTGEDPEVRRLAAFILNKGQYTITRVEVQFSPEGTSLLPHRRRQRVGSAGVLPSQLTGEGWELKADERVPGVLTPWDPGLRVESDDVHERVLTAQYPVVWWMDQWGTCWEHKRGQVRQVAEGEPWAP
jgi:hypothetical protein